MPKGPGLFSKPRVSVQVGYLRTDEGKPPNERKWIRMRCSVCNLPVPILASACVADGNAGLRHIRCRDGEPIDLSAAVMLRGELRGVKVVETNRLIVDTTGEVLHFDPETMKLPDGEAVRLLY